MLCMLIADMKGSSMVESCFQGAGQQKDLQRPAVVLDPNSLSVCSDETKLQGLRMYT